MDGDDILDASTVTTTHHDHDGNAVRGARTQHELIALRHPLHRNPESPQPIAFVRIGAGQVVEQIGTVRERGLHALRDRIEELTIAGAVRQSDVEIARLLAKRKVGRTVYGKGENRRIITEDEGGTITLMHIRIDHGNAADPALGLHRACRYGHVVEDTESLAAVRPCVVRTAREIDG